MYTVSLMIREATAFDALTVLCLAESYLEEAGEYAGLSYDSSLAIGNMMLATKDPNQLFILSLNSEKEVVGMLWAVCVAALPWSPEKVALDQIVYVSPEYRGTRHGLDLLRAYEDWAEEEGASEIRLSIASGVHETKTSKLYQKLGYSHLGSQYRRKL